MAIDPNERTLSEIVEKYVIRFGRTETPNRMAADLCAAERDLQRLEAEIDRLKRQISAGYIRKDVSSHYEAGWSPKAPLPDVIGDEWISTGREAA